MFTNWVSMEPLKVIELHTPNMARVMPMKIKRRDGFSVANASRMVEDENEDDEENESKTAFFIQFAQPLPPDI